MRKTFTHAPLGPSIRSGINSSGPCLWLQSWLVIALCLCSWATEAGALNPATPLPLNDLQSTQIIDYTLWFNRDATPLSADDIRKSYLDFQQGINQDWQPVASHTISPLQQREHWFALPISNPNSNNKRWILENKDAVTPSMVVYQISDKKLQLLSDIGSHRPYSARPIDHHKLLTPVELAQGESGTLLIKLDLIPMLMINNSNLRSRDSFGLSATRLDFLEWSLYGTLSMLGILGLCSAIALRDPLHLYLTLFVFSCFASAFHVSGYAYQWWWRDIPTGLNSLFFFASAMFLGFSQFVNLLLSWPKRFPRLSKWNRLYTSYIALSMIAFLFTSQVQSLALYSVTLATTFAYFVTTFTVALRQWFESNRLAGQFCLLSAAFMMITFFRIIFITQEQNISSDYINLAWEFSFILFAFTLLFISLDRAKDLRDKEKKSALESEAKSAFLAKMSHEIRTPMNGVIGMSTLLNDTSLNDTQQYYNNVIKSSGEALLGIINDILDYSKIQSGKMLIDNVDFDLITFTSETTSLFSTLADNKGVDLLARIDPNLPKVINSDPLRLRQIIMNLLSNALKFTAKGQVILDVCLSHDQQLLIKVTDSGIGIPPEKFRSLFEAFTQVEAATSREYGGTGLGLSICMQLSQLMGGNITVNSEEGLGTEFTLTLPFAEGNIDHEIQARLHADLKNYKILLLSNCQYYLTFAAETFKAANLTLDTGKPGTDLLLPGATGPTPYAVILIDTQSLSAQQNQTLKNVIDSLKNGSMVVALHPLTESNNIKEDLPLSPPHFYHHRPIITEGLINVIAKALKLRRHSEDVSSCKNEKPMMQTPRATKSLNILVVEDNLVNYQVACALLKKAGHHVSRAENGAIAVELVCQPKTADSERFDLVFMDCEMPVMDGFEAVRRIRAAEAEHGATPLPIIALTAHAVQDRLQECLKQGMNDYLLKPIDRHLLIEKTQQWSDKDYVNKARRNLSDAD